MCACPCDPCAVTPTNTAECESLPSALENFITQFFGTITKTVVDGRVVWELPCDLATGIPENPREEGEGLACYFKRLFEDGYVGATGPAGPAGAAGATGPAGSSSFSDTSADFTEPAVDDSVNIFLVDAAWVIEGMFIFVENSGFYEVVSVVGNTVLGTFRVPGPVSGGVIPGGSHVGPSGARGPVGPAGP